MYRAYSIRPNLTQGLSGCPMTLKEEYNLRRGRERAGSEIKDAAGTTTTVPLHIGTSVQRESRARLWHTHDSDHDNDDGNGFNLLQDGYHDGADELVLTPPPAAEYPTAVAVAAVAAESGSLDVRLPGPPRPLWETFKSGTDGSTDYKQTCGKTVQPNKQRPVLRGRERCLERPIEGRETGGAHCRLGKGYSRWSSLKRGYSTKSCHRGERASNRNPHLSTPKKIKTLALLCQCTAGRGKTFPGTAQYTKITHQALDPKSKA